MALYRKKTLTPIEPYTLGMEDGFKDGQPYIKTNLGDMKILNTDMIATGIAGERYPIREEIFLSMYENVETIEPELETIKEKIRNLFREVVKSNPTDTHFTTVARACSIVGIGIDEQKTIEEELKGSIEIH